MCCLDLLLCCCGPAACGLCCFGNKVKSSVTTRLLYMTFLFFVLVVSSIMLAPSVQQGLANAVSDFLKIFVFTYKFSVYFLSIFCVRL